MNLLIDDKCQFIEDIESKAMAIKLHSGLDCIMVDYLQKINIRSKPKATPYERVSEVSSRLKSLAVRLECPVIAAAQISRDYEKRSGEKIPLLSDLKESGQIEQDADLVTFIVRPHLFDAAADPREAEWYIAKNRHGKLATVNLQWEENTAKYYSEDEPLPYFGGQW